MFFCEICEVFKNNYFEEHIQMTASDKHQHRKHQSFSRNENHFYATLGKVHLAVSNWKKDSNSEVLKGELHDNDAIV